MRAAVYVDMVSQLYWAERVALEVLARMRRELPEACARDFLETQLADEARHAELYLAYLSRAGELAPLDPGLVLPREDPAAWAARLGEYASGARPLPSADACRAFACERSWGATGAAHRVLYEELGVLGRGGRRRVVFVDHTAQRSGGEIALVRLIAALDDVDAHVILFEDGPLVDDLRAALMRRPDQFVQTMTENMMMFALGRTVEHHDMPAVRAIVRDAAEQDYRFSALVLGVVQSTPFRMRTVPGAEGEVKEAALHDE